MSEPYVAELDFYVRYAETDTMGVVHHSSYVIYMEEARSHYARTRGYSYAEFEESGYYLVVSDLTVRYHAPARYGDQLQVRCWIAEIKSRRLAFAYEIRHYEGGQLLVSGQTQHICITKAGELQRIPQRLRDWAT